MSYSMSLNLQQKANQSLKQTQRLIMSPQMQQAIHLLQMPIMELTMMVEAEMEKNPVLEYIEDCDSRSSIERDIQEESQNEDIRVEREISFDDRDFEIMKRLDEEFGEHFIESFGFQPKRTAEEEKLKSYVESSIRERFTLFEYLMKQARQTFEHPKEKDLAEAIIGNFDERGFLEMSIEEISLLYDSNIELLNKILKEIQTFDPPGVGSRDVRESLLIQLARMGKRDSVAYRIVDLHYQDLLYNKIPLIKKSLSVSSEEIHEAIHKDIAKLDLYPGTLHSQDIIPYIKADVTVYKEEGKLLASIDGEYLPSLKLNPKYLKMMGDEEVPEETKEYIRAKIASGKWLMRNIHQRNNTLLKITEYLADKQKDFFESPSGYLLPLTMKTVAEDLDLHESTIARAVSNKYVNCFRGLLPLRSFFTNAYTTDEGEVSSRTVKEMLGEIIKDENKMRPLSDEAISSMIKEKGVPCARRTVAKYRRELNIGNSSQRRAYH